MEGSEPGAAALPVSATTSLPVVGASRVYLAQVWSATVLAVLPYAVSTCCSFPPSDSPGHQTDWRALALHFTIPWCPPWRL
jgi:hypothetical protein